MGGGQFVSMVTLPLRPSHCMMGLMVAAGAGVPVLCMVAAVRTAVWTIDEWNAAR